jgi:hypothetical protein
MPNSCENDLKITGPVADVSVFLDHARGEDEGGEPLVLDFTKFMPQPDPITPAMIRHPVYAKWAEDHPEDELWYFWRLEHWGTKWQGWDFVVDGPEVWGGEAVVTVSFDTAWSPPLPVVLAMSRRYPTLEFDLRYFECGCGFNGMYLCQGGEVLVDRTADYFGTRGR